MEPPIFNLQPGSPAAGNELVTSDAEHHSAQHWLFRYVFSTDHKTIAKQYLITGILWAIVGGSLSSLFRLQLGWPEASMEWLRPLLGKWIAGASSTPSSTWPW